MARISGSSPRLSADMRYPFASTKRENSAFVTSVASIQGRPKRPRDPVVPHRFGRCCPSEKCPCGLRSARSLGLKRHPCRYAPLQVLPSDCPIEQPLLVTARALRPAIKPSLPPQVAAISSKSKCAVRKPSDRVLLRHDRAVLRQFTRPNGVPPVFRPNGPATYATGCPRGAFRCGSADFTKSRSSACCASRS